MAIQVINVGSSPNDGLGDPLRTAYQKCNTNFADLNSRAQTTPPEEFTGTVGDQAGMYAYDNGQFYWCFQDYDGSSTIWATFSAQVLSNLAAGNSRIRVFNNADVAVTISNVANVAVFSTSGTTTNNLTVSNTATISGDVSTGNILPIVDATYNLGSPDLQWNSLYLGGETIFLGNAQISVNNNNLILTSPDGSEVTVGNAIGSFQNVVATANVTSNVSIANRFIGDGQFLTNITTISNVAVSQIANSTTILSVASAGAPLTFTVGGVANVLVVNSSNIAVTGAITASGNVGIGTTSPAVKLDVVGAASVTGNVTGGNLITAGLGSIGTTLAVTGNANVGNLGTAGLIVATGNVTGGNLITAGLGSIGTTLAVTGNANVGNLGTAGLIVATGNVTGGNLVTAGLVVATGNVTGGNLVTAGLVVATGNVTGGNLVTAGLGSIGTTLAVTGNANVGNLGTAGLVVATGNVTGGNLITAGLGSIGTTLAVTGNITGGNVNTAGKVVASTLTSNVATGTAPLTISSTTLVTNLNADLLDGYNTASTNTASTVVIRDASGNFSAGTITATLSGAATTAGTVTTAAQPNITSVGTLSSVSVTGNITGGNLTTAGIITVNSGGAATAIVNGGSNGVGNIGSSTTYFNTVFAKATSAQYADLAELYVADKIYDVGTVVIFGGNHEITESNNICDPAVAGVISSGPAYLMNSGQVGDRVMPVALAGKVLCKVKGPITKGQLLVSSSKGHAQAYVTPPVGTVLGKALQNFEGDEGMIEVVVGLH